jgi:hypothetical protein
MNDNKVIVALCELSATANNISHNLHRWHEVSLESALRSLNKHVAEIKLGNKYVESKNVAEHSQLAEDLSDIILVCLDISAEFRLLVPSAIITKLNHNAK